MVQLPHPHLQKYIRNYWMVSTNFEEQYQFITYLPKGVCFMTICVDAPPVVKIPHLGLVTAPMISINGQTKGNQISVGFKGVNTYVGIDFQVTGLSELLGIPMHEFTDTAINLEDIFPQESETLLSKIRDKKGMPHYAKVLDEFFLENGRFTTNNQLTKCSAAVNSVLHNSASNVTALSHYLNISDRQLRNVFNEHVGISPKNLLSISRFRKLYYQLQYSPAKPLDELAFDMGYFDLSHMVKEFKKFTGAKPTSLLKEEQKRHDNYFKLY